ncbi:MAG TPA: hypothetical protein PLM25_04880 [Limnochordia bacterium]|nr:hypothetical protein [Limnochordia bacterium]
MKKSFFVALSLMLMLLGAAAVQAAAVITVQVEILGGFSIDCSDLFNFGAVMPGQSIEETLELKVWSNRAWDLYVSCIGPVEVPGTLEVEDQRGLWQDVASSSRLVLWDQTATGSEGSVVHIPFRLSTSYADAPGEYEFQIEFTVVPSL